MRTYEALYIVVPDLSDDEVQTVADGVIKLITDNGGAIVRSEIWGKRRLAYQVKKHNEGVYVLVRFESDAPVIAKLKSYFRLADAVIRHLVVHFDEKTLRLEAEQEQRNQAQLEARAAAGRRRDDDDDDDEDDDAPRRRPSRPAARRRTEDDEEELEPAER